MVENRAGAPPADAELRSLGDGEQQAIALAQLLNADLLLCDDKDARAAALRKKLRAIGTLGVLQEAARNGFLDLSDTLVKLKKTNFRISQALIENVLREFRHPK